MVQQVSRVAGKLGVVRVVVSVWEIVFAELQPYNVIRYEGKKTLPGIPYSS